ncbi:hypothetical protein VTN00DRAFT_10257 [Thermoascus crustaceus]|uniref:uncharacterized protein n=1 Tax=Thermoascus crustaceus TaxID=5088 RepID=UPI00374258E2
MIPQPPTYTRSQLTQYLKRIRYHEQPAGDDGESRLQHLERSIRQDPLAALSELQRRHLNTIPFGSTVLHYSPHQTITLHPETLFHKLVERKLDGNHMVLIVTIGENKYMVDVGFGPLCATRPLLLKEDGIIASIFPAEMRLVKDSISEFIDKSQKVWIYQVRFSPESAWLPGYCFSEVEFLPQDFAIMNLNTSTSRSSFFTYKVIAVRMILNEEEDDTVGQYVLSENQVKRRINGNTEILETLQTETDRVNALAKWFDMHLRPEEVQAIRGMVSEITKA